MTMVRETSASTPERLEIVATMSADPDDVWNAFTEAGGLTSWWADEAHVDATTGGTLIAHWPSMGWTMRGTYRALEPGRLVAFTWSWDHESDTPERLVSIDLTPDGEATRLVLRHGDYGPDDGDERAAHLAGWEHFLPRLATTVERR